MQPTLNRVLRNYVFGRVRTRETAMKTLRLLGVCDEYILDELLHKQGICPDATLSQGRRSRPVGMRSTLDWDAKGQGIALVRITEPFC